MEHCDESDKNEGKKSKIVLYEELYRPSVSVRNAEETHTDKDPLVCISRHPKEEKNNSIDLGKNVEFGPLTPYRYTVDDIYQRQRALYGLETGSDVISSIHSRPHLPEVYNHRFDFPFTIPLETQGKPSLLSVHRRRYDPESPDKTKTEILNAHVQDRLPAFAPIFSGLSM